MSGLPDGIFVVVGKIKYIQLGEKMKRIVIFVFCLLFIINAAYAQSPLPSENLQQSIKQEERTKALEERVQEEKKKLEEIEEKVGQDPKDEKIVLLKKLMFSQSDVLPQSFFDALKQKYENTKMSVNDIYAIVNAINNEYMLKGYISSQAFLSKQNINSGDLFISLVEGTIDKINLKGNKYTNEKYIKRYINFDNADSLNTNDTNRQIMNFNAANDAKARIVLAPGQVFGTSDIDIVIDEPKWYQINAFIDNAGQDETGIIRYGLYSSIRSLTGYRDILNLGGVLSEGSHAAFLSYEIPEPLFGFRVGAGFNYSDTQIVKGQLEPLNVKGDYYGAYIFLKRPFYVREKTVSNVSFNAGSGRGASSITGYTAQDAKSDYLSLTGDNMIMTSFGYLYNSLTYTQGLKIIEGETNFEKITYYGEFYSSIIKYVGAVLKLKGQAAFDIVPASEQFTIGGDGTVRGYNSGIYMSKNGLAATLEINYSFGFLKYKFLDYLSAFVFGDYASVLLDKEADPFAKWSANLFSAGAGIKIGAFKYVEGSFIWAVPLSERDREEVHGSKFMFIVQGRI
ncbi:MAG: BamA/TamA family outer membrane protein [Endomicrobium sp.]|nr:BamA/TamA family outer membrane protein [Endomicrobium sp.]